MKVGTREIQKLKVAQCPKVRLGDSISKVEKNQALRKDGHHSLLDVLETQSLDVTLVRYLCDDAMLIRRHV